MKFLVIGAFLISLYGCCGSSKSLTLSKLNYNINFGSGGGFTGYYDGYFIDTTGSIVSWTGKTFETANLQELRKLSSPEITSLNELITNLKILNTSYRKPGNMTRFIILSNDSVQHRVSWEEGIPGNEVPRNLQTFYKKLTEIIKSETNK